jgi:hypothetical protein
VLKKILAVVLALILLAVPLAARWLYFYQGQYRPASVPRPDVAAINAPTPEIEPFVDEHVALLQGTILVDQAHDNRFQMTELDILQSRLSARGQRLEPVVTADELAQGLRGARALIVISPGTDWLPAEVEQVRRFVDGGGRLLMITDPTRYQVTTDDFGSAFLDDDAPHINELAARFGLIFQTDYLYNTVDNEGNFRNIKLTDFDDAELTRNLHEVVFYASHSIVSQEPVLIGTDGETRSSSSQRSDALPVAVLAADGAVLGLGDLTFLTEPYNAAYDNDQFIANIADFLAGARRRYELVDFPFFFGDSADLVYAGDPLLNGGLLTSGSDLQALFAETGKELTVRNAEDEARDTLFLGLYQEAEEVEPYLATAGITLHITPTKSVEDNAPAEPAPTGAEPPAATSEITPERETTLPEKIAPGAEITVTAEITPATGNRIAIESVGEMVLTSTSLLLLQPDGERQVLVVLAESEAGLDHAVERLSAGDLDGCLLQESEPPAPTTLALCPTGEVAPGEEGGGWQPPEPEPPPLPTSTAPVTGTGETVTDTVPIPEPDGEPQGSVMIVAMDKGEGHYDSMTSLDDYAAILQGRYQVATWSLAQDGPPDGMDLLEYDLIIWTFGDFDSEGALEEVADALIAVVFGEVPFIMSGAYIGDANDQGVQRDILVGDETHPVARNFDAGQVIDFVAPPSGSEYEVSALADVQEGEGTAVFVRGPNSELAGSPAILAAEDEASGARFAFIGFPLYLLPEEPRTQVVLNTVDWLLHP